MKEKGFTIDFDEIIEAKNILKAITNIQGIVRSEDILDIALDVRYTILGIYECISTEAAEAFKYHKVNISEDYVHVYYGRFPKGTTPWAELYRKVIYEAFKINGFNLEPLSKDNKIFKLSKLEVNND